MSRSLVHKDIHPWPNQLLTRAAIIWHTTTSTSRVWVRVEDLGDFILLVYPSAKDPGKSISDGFNSINAIFPGTHTH